MEYYNLTDQELYGLYLSHQEITERRSADQVKTSDYSSVFMR